MAAIGLTAADAKVNIVTAVDICVGVAAEAITAGDPCKYDTAGKFIRSLATSATAGRMIGVATKTVAAGMAVTLLVKGILDNLDLSALAYGDPVYLEDDGGLGTVAGTTSLVVGKVWAAHGQTLGGNPSKVLHVEL